MSGKKIGVTVFQQRKKARERYRREEVLLPSLAFAPPLLSLPLASHSLSFALLPFSMSLTSLSASLFSPLRIN